MYMYVCNVGSIEDSVHCSIAYKNLSFQPGEVYRRFIHVPYGATWAGRSSVDLNTSYRKNSNIIRTLV